MIARHVLISGRVQGVGFRWHTKEHARRLGLNGWVQNLADGRVEVWLEGELEPLLEMCAWLASGPSGAAVTQIEQHTCEPGGHLGFRVRHH